MSYSFSSHDLFTCSSLDRLPRNIMVVHLCNLTCILGPLKEFLSFTCLNISVEPRYALADSLPEVAWWE
jgi:hypothetical protein